MSKLDLTMYQGDTYQHRFTWQDSQGTPIDITGYSARMQARATASATSYIFESTDAEDDIVLGGVAGTIDLKIPGSKTAKLQPKNQVYDLELTSPDGTVTTLVHGTLTALAEVTR